MNTGIFGEGFPYSNFHDLNMDWIIKIAKDFLDQYTHIQEVIATGEESIQNLTEESLTELENKETTLENALQDWYDTHSEDIANQLADALTALNAWYTEHQNDINTILQQSIESFNQRATEKTAELLETIPADYTELSNDVLDIERIIYPELTEEVIPHFVQGEYYAPNGTTTSSSTTIRLYGVLPDTVKRITSINGYKFNVWAWNKTTDEYIGHIGEDGLFVKTTSYGFFTDYVINQSLNYKYSITLYKSDTSLSITPEDASNFFAWRYTDNTLTHDNHPADGKSVGDILLSNKSDFHFIQGGYNPPTGTATSRTNIIRLYGTLPDNTIRIQSMPGYKFNIWAWSKSDDTYIGHLQANGAFGKTDSYKYCTDYMIDKSLSYYYGITLYHDDTSTDILPNENTNFIAVYYHNQVIIETSNKPNFTGNPITIFSNNGIDAISNVDDGLLNSACVIKISESMYYLYYEGFGLNGGTDYSDINLCFAYSEDGENFIKGFPAGVTPPIANTNLLLPKGSTHGHCVVKVQDDINPFRMLTVDGNSNNREVKFWTSPDGINWTYKKKITNGYNDNFISCVVRGNLLKIFLRTRDNCGRAVGTIITDINGNRFNSSWTNKLSLGNLTTQLYQASASIWDDKREILFPTVYNPTTSAESIRCLILNGDKCEQVNIDTSNIMPNTIKSIYVSPGIINIGNKCYLYYSDQTTDHEHLALGTTVSRIRRIEITDETIPDVVRP